jgi:dynein heavy chain
VFDYTWDTSKREWQSWITTIPEYNVDIKMSFSEILVPTLDSIRMKFFLKFLVKNGKFVLCPGPTGTGKTVNIVEALLYEMTEDYQTIAMTFSAQTSAN